MKQLVRIFLKICGWKFELHSDIRGIRKAIILAAPHTSMWDFVWGKLVYVAMGLKVKFLIAKEFFSFPLGPLLKRLGGYHIDRKSPRMIFELRNRFQNSDQFIITFCPEGTRKKVEHWGKGFYNLATRANVPVFLGSIDYKNKKCTVGQSFHVSGNFDQDMEQMKRFYRPEMAKYPEQFAFHKTEKRREGG